MRVAMAGSAANPPHLGHLQMVQGILDSGRFDLVYWLVSGNRRDKTIEHLADRMAMTDLTFPTDVDNLIVKMGMYQFGFNIPTIEWLENYHRLYPSWDLTWVVGQEALLPQEIYDGKGEVEAVWVRGSELLNNWPCLVVNRPNFPKLPENKIPPQGVVADFLAIGLSSTQVRDTVVSGESFDHLVTAEVAAYIKRHKLYGYGGQQ